jgi:hypothetical protein
VYKPDPVVEGVLIEHILGFTNSGKAPLVIPGYEVSCSCTKAYFPSEPIMPGDMAEIKVTFDSEGKIGWQYRTVVLQANTRKPREVEIRVKVM